MLQISDVYSDEYQNEEKLKSNIKFGIHVCLPCIVQSYDSVNRTVEVQPSIRERIISENGEMQYVNYPLLINVPVVFPQCGGYYISFPINAGDECIVVFSDLCIDDWWIKGGVQNPVDIRRHDLSDGIAIFGIRNKNRYTNEISLNSLLIKNENTGVGIEIKNEDIELSAIVTRKTGTGLETRSLSSIFTTLFPDS